jgi:hypothetical protein
VRTGNFSLYIPHFRSRDGIQLAGMSRRLVLEGRDFPRITGAAARSRR